jgi:hypothetical protein
MNRSGSAGAERRRDREIDAARKTRLARKTHLARKTLAYRTPYGLIR